MALDLTDKTSNNNDLTNSGAAESSDVPFNGANNSHSANLVDASTQYFSIADGSQTGLDITTDFTIECWLKASALGKTQSIVTKDDYGSASRSYRISLLNTNKLSVTYFQDNTTKTQLSTDAAVISSTGVWVHIAAVVDISAQTAVTYVNGASVANTVTTSNATTIQNGTAPFAIGTTFNSGTGDGSEWDGDIDDVRVWSDIRTAQEISDNMAKELVGNEAGLVGYWKFNNDATDSTSNNNDLTAVNSPTYSTDVGFYGNNEVSADFELSDSDYMYITDASQTGLDITGDISVEAWVKIEQLPSTAGAYFDIVNKYSGFTTGAYRLGISNTDNKIQFIALENNTGNLYLNCLDNSDTFTGDDVGKWIHVAAVIDISAQTCVFYKNGIATAGTTYGSQTGSSIRNSSDDFYVGAWGAVPQFCFDGLIDEVRVWNDIRTPAEIANNMTRQLVGNEAGLVGYWNWESASTTAVKDIIGQGFIPFAR